MRTEDSGSVIDAICCAHEDDTCDPAGLLPAQLREVDVTDPIRRIHIASLMQALVDFEAGVNYRLGYLKSHNAKSRGRELPEVERWFFEDVRRPGPFAFETIAVSLDLSIDKCRAILRRWLQRRVSGGANLNLGARRLRGDTGRSRRKPEANSYEKVPASRSRKHLRGTASKRRRPRSPRGDVPSDPTLEI